MGTSCSICDSDRQAEVNLDELRHASVSEGVAEVHVHRGAREKKEKKDKKSKKGKKEKRAAEAAGLDLEPPADGPAPKVPLVRLTLPLIGAAEAAAAARCAPEDSAAAPGAFPDAAELARQQATPAAPQGPGQHGARRWSTLPSVGTWLKPLPRGPARVVATAAAEADAAQAAQAVDATDPLPSSPCYVTKVSSVDSFVALATSGLQADSPKPLHEQPDLIELFECPVPDKALAPPPAVEEEALVGDCAAQGALLAEAFLADALAWPAADKEVCQPSKEEWAEATPAIAQAVSHEPSPLSQVHSAGAGPVWHLRPSVGTWLHVKVRPLALAPAAVCPPCEEPAAAATPSAARDAARGASPPEAGVATTTGAASGWGGGVSGVEVSYGLEPPVSWQEEAPMATPAGSPDAGSRTTTTTTLADGTTTASVVPRRIISM